MPMIGSNYFPRDDFELYVQKIWLDRPKLMKRVPIRSTQLEDPGEVPSGFLQRFIGDIVE